MSTENARGRMRTIGRHGDMKLSKLPLSNWKSENGGHVVNTLSGAGIARPVAELKPMMTIRG